jgi:hypothetical protein
MNRYHTLNGIGILHPRVRRTLVLAAFLFACSLLTSCGEDSPENVQEELNIQNYLDSLNSIEDGSSEFINTFKHNLQDYYGKATIHRTYELDGHIVDCFEWHEQPALIDLSEDVVGDVYSPSAGEIGQAFTESMGRARERLGLTHSQVCPTGMVAVARPSLDAIRHENIKAFKKLTSPHLRLATGSEPLGEETDCTFPSCSGLECYNWVQTVDANVFPYGENAWDSVLLQVDAADPVMYSNGHSLSQLWFTTNSPTGPMMTLEGGWINGVNTPDSGVTMFCYSTVDSYQGDAVYCGLPGSSLIMYPDVPIFFGYNLLKTANKYNLHTYQFIYKKLYATSSVTQSTPKLKGFEFQVRDNADGTLYRMGYFPVERYGKDGKRANEFVSLNAGGEIWSDLATGDFVQMGSGVAPGELEGNHFVPAIQRLGYEDVSSNFHPNSLSTIDENPPPWVKSLNVGDSLLFGGSPVCSKLSTNLSIHNDTDAEMCFRLTKNGFPSYYNAGTSITDLPICMAPDKSETVELKVLPTFIKRLDDGAYDPVLVNASLLTIQAYAQGSSGQSGDWQTFKITYPNFHKNTSGSYVGGPALEIMSTAQTWGPTFSSCAGTLKIVEPNKDPNQPPTVLTSTDWPWGTYSNTIYLAYSSINGDGSHCLNKTPCELDPSQCAAPPECAAPEWDSTKSYHGGTCVCYEGQLWKANWDSTAGVSPGNGYGTWKKIESTDECSS